MAELGETASPAALIPGSPEDLYRTVGALIQYADLLAEGGDGLSRIDTTSSWNGPAADAFRRAYQAQPKRWLDASEAFRDAAAALDGYAGTLSRAQQQALSAIKLWDSGNHTDQASAMEVLNNARNELDSARDLAARAVSNAASKAPPAPGFWSQVGHGMSSWLSAASRDPGAAAASVAGGVMDLAGIAMLATGVGAAPAAAVIAGGVAVGAMGDAVIHRVQQQDQQAADGAGVTYSPAAPVSAQQVPERARQLGYGQVIPPQNVPSTITAANQNSGPVYSDGSSYLVAAAGGGWKLYDSSGNILGSYSSDLSGPSGQGPG